MLRKTLFAKISAPTQPECPARVNLFLSPPCKYQKYNFSAKTFLSLHTNITASVSFCHLSQDKTFVAASVSLSVYLGGLVVRRVSSLAAACQQSTNSGILHSYHFLFPHFQRHHRPLRLTPNIHLFYP